MKDKPQITANDLFVMLKNRYCGGGSHIAIREVANSTGFAKTNMADAIVVALWPSAPGGPGCCRGFEFKISRSDWLREIGNPWKAEQIAKFCSTWHVIVSDPKIVKPGELPKGHGLLVAHGDSLREVVKPTPRKPIPIDPGFMASIIRSGIKAGESDALANGIRIGRDEVERERGSSRLPDSDALSKRKKEADKLFLDASRMRQKFHQMGDTLDRILHATEGEMKLIDKKMKELEDERWKQIREETHDRDEGATDESSPRS